MNQDLKNNREYLQDRISVLLQDEERWTLMLLELRSVINPNRQQLRRMDYLDEKIKEAEQEQEIYKNRLEDLKK